METNIQNKKCELCTMLSTHTEVDAKNVTHYFCEHHSLKSVAKKTNENKLEKLMPLFGVFLFIILFSSIRQFTLGYSPMLYMMDFMGIFFLVFGLFKLVDLKGFVIGFKQYDFIAQKINIYGYVYPFLEIFLGFLYLIGVMFLAQNLLVLFLSGMGIYTAYKYIDHEEDIRCVCLGTLFDLPMTWVTFAENSVMFVMVVFMMLI